MLCGFWIACMMSELVLLIYIADGTSNIVAAVCYVNSNILSRGIRSIDDRCNW